MGEDTRVTWHRKKEMHGGFRAPSSPLLLNLRLMQTTIFLLLLYNCFGNKSIGEKNPGWVQAMGRYVCCPKALQGIEEKEQAQGEMLSLICTQSSKRSKTNQ